MKIIRWITVFYGACAASGFAAGGCGDAVSPHPPLLTELGGYESPEHDASTAAAVTGAARGAMDAGLDAVNADGEGSDQ